MSRSSFNKTNLIRETLRNNDDVIVYLPEIPWEDLACGLRVPDACPHCFIGDVFLWPEAYGGACLSCGWHSDLIGTLTRLLRLSRTETIRLLAKRCRDNPQVILPPNHH